MIVKKLALITAFAVCVVNPIPAQNMPRQGLVKPIWITALPNEPGRVYAMGVANFTPSEAQAIKQACQSARIEVLTRLRANVKGETNIQNRAAWSKDLGGTTSGSSSNRVSQDSQIKTQAAELPGLAVVETWSDQDARTAYALAYLDVSIAERELRTRFDATKKDLAMESGNATGPRERMRKLQRLKKGQVELTKLDDMAALLAAGGGDAALRADIRDQRLSVERQMDALRATLVFCLKGDRDFGVGADIVSLVRNAVLKEGLGWADSGGEFILSIRYMGSRSGWDISRKRWWDYQHTGPDFIAARGVIEITLSDTRGTSYESTTIEAKGVGVTEFTADRALIKEFKAKLETAIGQWLDSMVN
jgi:hypothetical protein